MTELAGDPQNTFSKSLREAAMDHISTEGIDEFILAEKLDIFPEGARRILRNKAWSPELGLSVLDALDVTVEVNFPVQNAGLTK